MLIAQVPFEIFEIHVRSADRARTRGHIGRTNSGAGVMNTSRLPSRAVRRDRRRGWGRRGLNPDRRVSSSRGATLACSRTWQAFQSVITESASRSRQAHDWSPAFYRPSHSSWSLRRAEVSRSAQFARRVGNGLASNLSADEPEFFAERSDVTPDLGRLAGSRAFHDRAKGSAQDESPGDEHEVLDDKLPLEREKEGIPVDEDSVRPEDEEGERSCHLEP